MSNHPPEQNPGEISDGYHTFNELYDHRCTLFLALMKAHPTLSWMSWKHHDESTMDGWFIAGIKAPTGDVTYHLPENMWELARDTGAAVHGTGLLWDGHTPADVVKRIKAWIELPVSEKPMERVHEANNWDVITKLNNLTKRTNDLNSRIIKNLI